MKLNSQAYIWIKHTILKRYMHPNARSSNTYNNDNMEAIQVSINRQMDIEVVVQIQYSMGLLKKFRWMYVNKENTPRYKKNYQCLLKWREERGGANKVYGIKRLKTANTGNQQYYLLVTFNGVYSTKILSLFCTPESNIILYIIL